MAKRPPKATDETENQIDLEGLTNFEELSPALGALQAELGLEGDLEALVHVSMIDKDGKEYRVWKGVPEDYNLDELAKVFGSGDYKVQLRVRNEKGYMPVRGNRVIPMRVSPAEDSRIKRERENPAPVPGQQNAPAITAETLAAAVASAIKASMPPPAAVAPQPSTLEMLTAFANVAKTFMPVAQPAQGGIAPMEVMRSVMGMFKEMRNSRDVDDDETPRRTNANFHSLMETAIKHFAPMFEKVIVPQPVPGMPVSPGVPIVPVIQANPIEENPMQPQNVEVPKEFSQGVAFLLSAARGGHDPISYADVVENFVPENELDQLLATPNLIDVMIAINPEVATYRTWFEQLIKELTEDDDNPADPEAPAPVIVESKD